VEPLLIEKLMMKLSTKADRYSSAGTEAGICKWLMLQCQAQIAPNPILCLQMNKFMV
jgi:hypothetical protein